MYNIFNIDSDKSRGILHVVLYTMGKTYFQKMLTLIGLIIIIHDRESKKKLGRYYYCY